jgi:Transcription factor WhiB
MTRRYLSTPLRGNSWRMWDSSGEPWQHRAACRADESMAWFTKPRQLPPEELKRLALTCGGCPVLTECHFGAMSEKAHGVTRAGAWWQNPPDRRQQVGAPRKGWGRRIPWTRQYLSTGLLPTALFFANRQEDE